jgi:prepilin-type N-terminal cleavage/methylation domain-containing protein
VKRLRERRDDAGFTLAEMLVVIVLVGIVGRIVMSVTITSMKTASRQEDHTRTLNAAKVALERMTREIRGANSLTATDEREVAFVTRTGGVRRATRIYARLSGSNTELVQQDVRTDLATGAALGTTERVVLGGLAVGRSEAVFTYYAGDYYGEGDASTVALSPATPGAARTIGVRVRLLRGYGAAPLELYQVVSVRNLES